jgi:hypothetical protein
MVSPGAIVSAAGGEFAFVNPVLADNVGSVIFAGRQYLYNGLMVGASSNDADAGGNRKPRMGYGAYDGPGGLLMTHFAGWPEGSRPIMPITAAIKNYNHFVFQVGWRVLV